MIAPQGFVGYLQQVQREHAEFRVLLEVARHLVTIAFLWTTFGRYSLADAFEHLNGVSFLFWLVHSPLVLIAIAEARFRRSDMLTALLIGWA